MKKYFSKKQLTDSFELYGFDFEDCARLVNNMEIPYYEKIRLMEDYCINRESYVSDTILHQWSNKRKERFWRYGSKEKET